MSAPVVLAFCAPGPMRDRCLMLLTEARTIIHDYLWSESGGARDLREIGHPLILLGIGADGCAALVRRVEADGLDVVVAIVLIAPETVWAERETGFIRVIVAPAPGPS